MGELTRAERLQIMVTPDEVKLIDNWRFSKRMPSRASAVRELLKRGLMAEGFDVADDGAHSKDFRHRQRYRVAGCLRTVGAPAGSNDST